ncbi:LOW QUALITY PROTEIN: hypothetical protein Cgig2_027875 [Carnegiea gigantea]|uniref:Aminotransferase-like plant mobile domain-containing protein n=1 Tax=Carnegiea gigantea TaxID=171969 RepID=A0A9Q1KN03_9CARY|nr:LOW QUALITY PROTEIN: hypothetical protein Cgig2_027875 [Carnegiea gigantea]
MCEYWCPETNTLHTSKGEVSLSIFDIYSFLGLLISGRLYDEVVPTQRELASKLPLSCTYLFIAYHKLMQGRKGKPTIEQWISFWFRGCSKQPNPSTRNIVSPYRLRSLWWSDYQAIFDELGVATGQRTGTFLAAFLSFRDAGCIHPGTFSIVSLMASGYCLPIAILASTYKGLNELSRSSHLGRGGGHFPTHFLYAWLAKNFDVYELVGEASSSLGMVKFSGLDRAKSFQPEEAWDLIGSGRGFCWHSSVINRLRETLVDDGKLSRADFTYFVSVRSSFVAYRCEDNLIMEHYCPDRFSRQYGFYQDVPTDLDFDNLPDLEAMLHYHHMLTRCGTGPKSYFLGDVIHSRGIPLVHFVNDGPRCSSPCLAAHMLVVPRGNADEGKLKPKLKIVRSGELVEPFVPAMEDGSSRVKIPGIDIGTPAMPIPAIPIQSIAPLPQVIELPLEGAENIMDILDGEPNRVECVEGLAHVPLPSGSQYFPSVGRILFFGKDLFDNRSRLVNSWGVCPPDDDEVKSIRRVNAHSSVPHPQCPLKVPQGGISVFDADAFIKEVDKNAVRVFHTDKVCRTPFDGLPSLRGDFDSLYAAIFQRGVDVIPLESKVERLIRQACDFKDLQQSYSGRISVEEHNNCRMEVQGKLDEASRRLNTEGTHYEAKATELKHVGSRRQELLKELQLLEDQHKELSSQVAASEHLLQEVEREVIDLQGQIEVLNATEVMDAATKASLEKAEAYIKESFDDLKNFQWDP